MPLLYKAQTMVKNGGCFQNFTRAFASLLCMGVSKAPNLFSKEIHHKTLYHLINKRNIVAERLNKNGVAMKFGGILRVANNKT